MTSIVVALAFLSLLCWGAVKRRFLLYLLLFVAISFVWRLLSNVFLDVAGPIYAVELFREIGGGQAAVVLVAAHLVFLAALLTVFRSSRTRALARISIADGRSTRAVLRRHEWVARAVLAAVSLFIGLLFMDLLRIGVIPLFAGIERTTYTLEYGGVFHGLVVKYFIHLGFVLGVFYVWGTLLRGVPDNRFLLALFVVFTYLFLVGNRFSAFYGAGTAFLLPYGVIALRRQYGNGLALLGSPLRARPRARALQLGAVATGGAIVLSALVWSLTVTRGFDRSMAIANTVHRVAVIQGELWWATYERIFLGGAFDPARAVDGLFVRPIAPDRNTTIPYLMELEIGEKVYPILESGSVYTGGYPEVLFELLGPVWGFVGVFVMALILAGFLFALVSAIARVQYVRTFLLFYVMFPFLLFEVGGMLNVFTNYRFWVKASALLVWVLYEEVVRLRGLHHAGSGIEAVGAPA